MDSDRYGRTVALVFIPDGNKEIAVNAEMVRQSYAYYYRQYSQNCDPPEVFEKAEKQASASKLGVWKYKGMKPWDYRKANRG